MRLVVYADGAHRQNPSEIDPMTNRPYVERVQSDSRSSSGLSSVLLFALVCISGYPLMRQALGKQVVMVPPKWEHKVVQFDRDELGQFETGLDRLSLDGWEYLGPLCNNGMNAQLVAFRRPK